MLFLLWLPLAVAPPTPAAPAPPVTILSGHLAHAPAGDTVYLWPGGKEVKAPLSASGDFRFELKDLRQSVATKFTYAGQQTKLYLTPGDQLVMQLDFTDFDKTLVYSGKGSVENNYLAQSLYKFAYGPPSSLLRAGDWPTGTPTAARRVSDELRQARRAYLAEYAKSHRLPAAFVRNEQLTIDVDWATALLGYAFKQDGKGLPADYFDFLRETPTKEISQLWGKSYVDNSLVANFVMGYQVRLVPSRQLSTDPAEGPRLYQLATAELGEGRARDWVMEILLSSNMRSNLPGARAFYRTFQQHNHDSLTARLFRKGMANQQRIVAGQPAPDFTLLDNMGKQVSLSDFKGKVVYLDFWGTWCPPCMREMTEFSHDLKKQFEGRDVVFLYVSVGDPEAKWRQTIVEKQFNSPNSVHLRSPDQIIADTYLINGYPSYYLIGRDGRLLQPYTSRPSEGAKTVAAIEAALK